MSKKELFFPSENILTHCGIVIKFSGRGPTTFIKPNKIFFVTKKKYFTYELENIQTWKQIGNPICKIH